jgi:hypothetical protein
MELLPKEKVCKYCNKIYSDKTTLSRHKNNYCKLVPSDVKAKILAKRELRKKKEAIIQKVSIDKSTTNNDNKQINLVTVINICGNDVPEDVIKSIKEINEHSIAKLREYIPNLLSPYGSENLAHLVDDSKKIIKYFNNSPKETFKLILNDIHKFDENRNFAVPNVKFAIVQYVNDDYDISKSSKKDHIKNIQTQMRKLYDNLYSKYKDQIRARYHEDHEIFIKNMIRRYDDIVIDFNEQAQMERNEEIERLREEAEANSEIFDDRSIINQPLPTCNIPDYNKITKEIIETYLTSNSRINIECMKDHKDKVYAIKHAIGNKEPRKFKTFRDVLEEDARIAKQKEAERKVMEIIAKSQPESDDEEETVSDIVANVSAEIKTEMDEVAEELNEAEAELLAELEAARGAE